MPDLSNPHAQPAPPPSSESEAMRVQMARMQKSLEVMDKRLTMIQGDLMPESVQKPAPTTEAERKKAQWIATTGLGLIGMKLGALVFGKIGFGWELVRNGINWDEAKRQMDELRRNGQSMFEHPIFMKSLIWGGAGSIVGLIGGGALGYLRGDRIASPEMFFKEPIKTIKILFGKEPVKPEYIPSVKSIMEGQADMPPEADHAPQKNWRAAEAARQTSASVLGR